MTVLLSLIRELPAYLAAPAPSPSCLLSLVRTCTALYRLLSSGTQLPEAGDRQTYTLLADQLFRAVSQRLETAHCDSLHTRALLTEALYSLSRETGRCYDTSRAEVCDAYVAKLMNAYTETMPSDSAGIPLQTAVCRVLESFFYPEAWEEDEWFMLLRSTLADWCSSLSPEGIWEELPMEEAWRRLEVLNRYSYLFRDGEFDAETSQSARGYENELQSARISPEAWGCYLEAVWQGHLLYPSHHIVIRARRELSMSATHLQENSDRNLQNLSYAILSQCAINDKYAIPDIA